MFDINLLEFHVSVFKNSRCFIFFGAIVLPKYLKSVYCGTIQQMITLKSKISWLVGPRPMHGDR